MDSKKAAIPSVLIHFQEQDDWKSRKAGKNTGEEADYAGKSSASPGSRLNCPIPALNEGFCLFQTLFPLQKSLSTQDRSSLEVFTETNHVIIRPKGSSPDPSPTSPAWTIVRHDSLPSPPLTRKPVFRKKITSKAGLIDLDTPVKILPRLGTGLVRQSTLPYLGVSGTKRLGNSLTPRTNKATTLPALSPNNRTYRQFPTF